jgi:hypothetical protein
MKQTPPIDNRKLAEATGFSYHQVRRWVVAFLPPDPHIGLHSGKARTFTFDQSVRVYLGGFLVSRMGYTIGEAGQSLEDIFAWLKKMKLLPSSHTAFAQSRAHPDQFFFENKYPEIVLEIAKGKGGRDGYYAKKILSSREDPKKGNVIKVEMETFHFGETKAFWEAETRNLYLDNIISFLGNALCH